MGARACVYISFIWWIYLALPVSTVAARSGFGPPPAPVETRGGGAKKGGFGRRRLGTRPLKVARYTAAGDVQQDRCVCPRRGRSCVGGRARRSASGNLWRDGLRLFRAHAWTCAAAFNRERSGHARRPPGPNGNHGKLTSKVLTPRRPKQAQKKHRHGSKKCKPRRSRVVTGRSGDDRARSCSFGYRGGSCAFGHHPKNGSPAQGSFDSPDVTGPAGSPKQMSGGSNILA